MALFGAVLLKLGSMNGNGNEQLVYDITNLPATLLLPLISLVLVIR